MGEKPNQTGGSMKERDGWKVENELAIEPASGQTTAGEKKKQKRECTMFEFYRLYVILDPSPIWRLFH